MLLIFSFNNNHPLSVWSGLLLWPTQAYWPLLLLSHDTRLKRLQLHIAIMTWWIGLNANSANLFTENKQHKFIRNINSLHLSPHEFQHPSVKHLLDQRRRDFCSWKCEICTAHMNTIPSTSNPNICLHFPRDPWLVSQVKCFRVEWYLLYYQTLERLWLYSGQKLFHNCRVCLIPVRADRFTPVKMSLSTLNIYLLHDPSCPWCLQWHAYSIFNYVTEGCKEMTTQLMCPKHYYNVFLWLSVWWGHWSRPCSSNVA